MQRVKPVPHRLARLIGLYLLLAGVAVGRAEEIDLPKLAREARPGVVLLMIFGADGKEIATGTGFFVSPDDKLVTNWHVAKDAHSIEGHLEAGATFKVSGMLAGSPKGDIAILQAEPGKFRALPLGSVANVEVGSRVAVIGSPLGLEGTLSEGIVSAKRTLGGDEAWLQITAPISPGSSGSPVLNAKGEVIGVATLHLRGSQALNFAAPSDAVKRLIEEAAASNVIKTFAEVRRVTADIWEDSRVKTALAAIQSGDYAEALSQLQSVLKQHPDKGEVWHLQGAVFASLEFSKTPLLRLRKRTSSRQTWQKTGSPSARAT